MLNSNCILLNNNLTPVLSVQGLIPTDCVIIAGGYSRIGSIIIINIRLTKTVDAGSTIAVTGFPGYSGTLNQVTLNAFDYETNEKLSCVVTPQGELYCHTDINSNAGVIVSGCYICS